MTFIFFNKEISLLKKLKHVFNSCEVGLSAPFMGSLWAEIYGVKSIGTAKALLHAVGVFASALSPVVFGYIIDWGYGISVIFLISFIMIVVSSILPIIYKT